MGRGPHHHFPTAIETVFLGLDGTGAGGLRLGIPPLVLESAQTILYHDQTMNAPVFQATLIMFACAIQELTYA